MFNRAGPRKIASKFPIHAMQILRALTHIRSAEHASVLTPRPILHTNNIGYTFAFFFFKLNNLNHSICFSLMFSLSNFHTLNILDLPLSFLIGKHSIFL